MFRESFQVQRVSYFISILSRFLEWKFYTFFQLNIVY